MVRKVKYLFNIPVDGVTTREAAEACLSMIDKYASDERNRYIATLNIDYIFKCYGFAPSTINNGELLHALDSATLALPEDTPLLLLSKLLGAPLPERVGGAQLIWEVAKLLEQQDKSLYLLGGEEKVAARAAELLEERYPNLVIKGVACPIIDVAGNGLEDAIERDALVVEQINKVAPDLLLLNLGNPKQEIWWQRVHKDLRVPLTIGIDGGFAYLCSAAASPPPWMEQWGLQWLHHLKQEPGKLVKRSAIGAVKGSWLFAPLVSYHFINRWKYNLFYRRRGQWVDYGRNQLFISPHGTIVVVQLPGLLDGAAVEQLTSLIDQAFAQDHIILDFKHVQHAEVEGISFLIRTWNRAVRDQKLFSVIRVNGDMRLLFKLHRCWNTLGEYNYGAPKDILAKLMLHDNQSTFFDSIQQNDKTVILSFFGRVDGTNNYEAYLEHLAPIIKGRHLILDLSYCTYIDNVGIHFLFQLQKELLKQNRTLRICGIDGDVYRQLSCAKVLSHFDIRDERDLRDQRT